jgi:hypothetical protein
VKFTSQCEALIVTQAVQRCSVSERYAEWIGIWTAVPKGAKGGAKALGSVNMLNLELITSIGNRSQRMGK